MHTCHYIADGKRLFELHPTHVVTFSDQFYLRYKPQKKARKKEIVVHLPFEQNRREIVMKMFKHQQHVIIFYNNIITRPTCLNKNVLFNTYDLHVEHRTTIGAKQPGYLKKKEIVHLCSRRHT